MKQSELDELLDVLQLKIKSVDINNYNLNLVENKDISSFSWDRQDENQQADDTGTVEARKQRYISYLKKTIKIPDGSGFYDTKSKRSFLSLKHKALPFKMNGTTDVVIAKKIYADGYNLARGIQVVFELKKKVQDVHIPQAVGQLLTANIRSNEAVYVVLTDLNDVWVFFWLESQEHNNTIITQFTVCRSDAITIIEKTFENESNFPLHLRTTYNLPGYAPVGGVATEEAATEEAAIEEVGIEEKNELELFLTRSKVQLEFEDDVANMKDVYDVMSEEEIRDWKIRRALRLLRDSLDFQSFQLDDNEYINMYS